MGGKCIKSIKVIDYVKLNTEFKEQLKNINQNLPIIVTENFKDLKINNKNIGINKPNDNVTPHKRNLEKKLTVDVKDANKININPEAKLDNNKDILKTELLNSNSDANNSKGSLNLDPKASVEKSTLKIIKKNNREYENANLIDKCLTKHFFLRELDRSSRSEIIKEMSLCSFQKGEIIFEQNSIGIFFYIINIGRVELIINDVSVKTIDSGNCFGELALLHGAPRSGTIKALTDCHLWVLEKKSFNKIFEHINHFNYENNKKFIESIPILNYIDNHQKSILSSFLIKGTYDPGEIIFKEREAASCIYIINEGEVCYKRVLSSKTNILNKGQYFGLKAILLDCVQDRTAIARTKCVIYSISIVTLKSIIGENYKDVLYLKIIKSAFKISNFLHQINLNLFEHVYNCFTVFNYKKNDIVFSQGYNVNSKLTIIIEGYLINSKTKELIASKNDIVFEYLIFNGMDETIEHDIIASRDCLLLQADLDEITNILGGSFSELIKKGSIMESLMKIHLFRNLPPKKIRILSEKIGIKKYENGKKIISQGEEGSKFFIVKSGKVDIYIDNISYLRTLNENENFGERALFFKENRSASAIAQGSVELFYLEKEDFLSLIEDNLKEYLLNRLCLQDNTLELKDFDYIQQLGAGNYGQVSLVRSKKSNFLYAMKVITKKQIDMEQLHKNLELERSILLQIDHPFIVKLVKTLKDKDNIYFLMEFIKGKELFDVIRDIGLLNKYQAQFYGASMMLAVEYLHKRKFIYRDIKPENIMIIYNGYAKLIDFGTAKQIDDRTMTVIGTPHYMAPEVIMGEGYSFAVDFWSIGICMYEFMCGSVPFGESAEDPMDVYLSVIKEVLEFPNFCKDKDLKQFISLMLFKSQQKRISNLTQIKNNIWFKDFNWEDLIALTAEPPFKPTFPQEETQKNIIPYTTFIQNNLTEWEPEKKVTLEPHLKVEYAKWLVDF